MLELRKRGLALRDGAASALVPAHQDRNGVEELAGQEGLAEGSDAGHRPPFLPIPDADFWRFRMETAFGKEWEGRPSTGDVIDYLAWCQRARPPRR